MFNNAYTFNEPGSEIYKMTEEMDEWAQQELHLLFYPDSIKSGPTTRGKAPEPERKEKRGRKRKIFGEEDEEPRRQKSFKYYDD